MEKRLRLNAWFSQTRFSKLIYQVSLLAVIALLMIAGIGLLDYRDKVLHDAFFMEQDQLLLSKKQLAYIELQTLLARLEEWQMASARKPSLYQSFDRRIAFVRNTSNELMAQLSHTNILAHLTTLVTALELYRQSVQKSSDIQQTIGPNNAQGILSGLSAVGERIEQQLKQINKQSLIFKFMQMRLYEKDFSHSLELQLAKSLRNKSAEFSTQIQNDMLNAELKATLLANIAAYRHLVSQLMKKVEELDQISQQSVLRFKRLSPGIAAIQNGIDRRLGLTTEKLLQHEQTSSVSKAILFIVAFIALSLFTVYQIQNANTLVARLRQLANRMRDFASGQFSKLSDLPQGKDEVGMLAKTFSAMASHIKTQIFTIEQEREKAQQANHIKSQFLATMSHEIRTPVSGILGLTELLMKTDLSTQQRGFAEGISHSGESLLEVVNDILDFSKIEAGKLRLQYKPFDLRLLVETVGEQFAERAQRKGLELTCRVPTELYTAYLGDPARLNQILSNLVGNAIMFTEQGEVLLQVSCNEKDETEHQAVLKFEVCDTGPGISPQDQGRIFQSFIQAADTTARPYGGSGLGLAIAKQLAELTGGEIGVESALGKGSKFWFRVRLDKQPEQTTGAVSTDEALRDLRALIVDDNLTCRETLEHYLAALGVPCNSTASPRHVLSSLSAAAAREAPYKLALLDRFMPEMDGLQLVERIKADPAIRSTRIIIMGPVTSPIDVQTSAAFGIDYFLTKPVRLSQLRDALFAVRPSESDPQPRALANPSKPEASSKRFNGRRVIVVEDNPVNLKVAVALLENLGCLAEGVSDGHSALSALEQGGFDLVLMDCQMPELSGFEVTAKLREKERGSALHTPIIALTASAMEGDRERCLSAGMDDYLSKPYKEKQLIQMLDRWLTPQSGRMLTFPSDQTPIEALPNSGRSLTPLEPVAFANLQTLERSENPDVTTELISLYLEQAPQQIRILKESIARRDANALLQTVHSLKSSSAIFGAQKLAALCQAMEVLGRSNSFEDAAVLCSEAEKQFEAVRTALSEKNTSRHCVSANSSSQEETKILVVDDDKLARQLAISVLEKSGYQLQSAENGLQALTAFKRDPADIVLLDVMMPEMDGFATCAALRALPSGVHTPILMLTALDDMESINRAYEVGATDFITKPVNYPLLNHRVRYAWRAMKTAEELRNSQARLAKAQHTAQLGHWQWDLEKNTLKWSAEISRLFELSPKDATGTYEQFISFVHPEDREYVDSTIHKALRQGDSYSIDHRIVRTDGTECIGHQQAQVTKNGGTHLIGTLQNITDLRQAEHHIRQLAYYDSVTGLPNRAYLKRKLENTLAHAKRYLRSGAIFFLDLDQFKLINDTLGHSAGDELLKQVSMRLLDTVRSYDSITRGSEPSPEPPEFKKSNGTIARLGGDEFVMIASDIRHSQDAAALAQRIVDILALPFTIEGSEIHVTTSIGISLYPEDGDDPETLLKRADAAMYHAKEQGRNGYRFYENSINVQSMRLMKFKAELRQALEQNQLQLHFQPRFNLHTGQLLGLEALVRWHHPDKGVLLPADFIPLAEETGLIVPLGEWVLRNACVQIKAWQNAGLEHLSISVNLSALQFNRKNLVAQISEILQETEVSPQYLELELTESTLMENIDESMTLLGDLKEIGVKLSIDNFGTGFSSLAYLKRFPIDALKIERSFIHDLITDVDDAAIVASTIALAHNLGFKVVAEGVEREAQLKYLQDRGCDAVQGYLFSRPMAPESFMSWFQEKRQSIPITSH